MGSVPAERLADVFVEVADTLVDEFDLIEFLQMVTTRSAELVDAVTAGLLLADARGSLQLMAASDESTRLLELFQVQTEEGPCQDAFHGGAPVVNEDLSAAGARWPRFAPRAVAAGFRSVHALPMRHRGNVIGALNLFSASTGWLAPADVRVVQAMADVATIALLQERALRRAEELSDQLQAALDSRVVIEQAKGALAQMHGIQVDVAFERMRAYARNNGRGLIEVAIAVVRDPAGVSGLTAR